ncbi:MAG: hypothetical protein H6748_16220 [Spirochaetaceae bacterium]|nr:hypothetical protein [Myxococcales bacterium]MCB9725594.1 hypothetical protein [Spirochaetaceae bacterium]
MTFRIGTPSPSFRHVSTAGLLACLASLLLVASGASAQGFIEINQAVVDANGGFPYVITAPGSYRLTGNLIKTGADGSVNAIEIDSSNVDLDLRGFFMAGPGTCTRNPSTYAVTCTGHVPGQGVLVSVGSNDVTIRSGIIKGFFNGVVSSALGTRADSLSVNEHAFVGVQLFGDGSEVQNVSAQRNGTSGITVQNHSHVTQCNASQNDDYGVLANLNSSVDRSYAMGNRLGGMSLNPTATFFLNSVLDNLGTDPVFSGIDGGGNICTNAAGSAAGC